MDAPIIVHLVGLTHGHDNHDNRYRIFAASDEVFGHWLEGAKINCGPLTEVTSRWYTFDTENFQLDMCESQGQLFFQKVPARNDYTVPVTNTCDDPAYREQNFLINAESQKVLREFYTEARELTDDIVWCGPGSDAEDPDSSCWIKYDARYFDIKHSIYDYPSLTRFKGQVWFTRAFV